MEDSGCSDELSVDACARRTQHHGLIHVVRGARGVNVGRRRSALGDCYLMAHDEEDVHFDEKYGVKSSRESGKIMYFPGNSGKRQPNML